MAASNADIFKQALILAGALDYRKTPSAALSDLCLTTYGPLVRSLPGWAQWNEIEVNQDYTAGDDERITVTGDVTVTITLPQLSYVEPYITFDGSGFTVKNGEFYRAPRDGARVQVNAQQGDDYAYYAYRSDTGKWIQVHDMESAGTVPLNEQMHDHLAVFLATRMGPKIGLPVSSDLASLYREAQAAMWAAYGKRYRMPSTVDDEASYGAWM